MKAEVFESFKAQPQKNELSASLVVKKLCVDEYDEKKPSKCVNSDMERIFYCEGLSDEIFPRMLDQMMSIRFIFTSKRRGWILQENDGVEVRPASPVPIKGSS